MQEPEQPLYTGASHPVRRRPSVTETCLLSRIHGAYTLAVQLEAVSAEGWRVACNTARSEMGLALCVIVQSRPQLVPSRCHLFCPMLSGQHGGEWGIVSFPRVLLCLTREPLVSVLPAQHYSQVCHCCYVLMNHSLVPSQEERLCEHKDICGRRAASVPPSPLSRQPSELSTPSFGAARGHTPHMTPLL